ncbi:hypothetical protein AVEN_131163-1 [Araneus ventricosus]|uniref:Reverse transcriptase domain-containing protein n=1 Tax=Araneus ventricosus TaxID=182803 RepID=A0A4Y2MLN6_ARAVE|nr:hypothetical protein AVEN_131163-1 [Araneus ventricosus]
MGSKKWRRKKKSVVASSSEPPDEAITDPQFVLGPPLVEPEAQPLPPQDEGSSNGPLSISISHIEDFLNQDPTEEFFHMFCETVEMAVADIQNISFQQKPTPSEQGDENSPEQVSGNLPEQVTRNRYNNKNRRPQREINIEDPQSCQTLFGRNRKKAVREICDGPPIRCEIPMEIVEDHFRKAWDSAPSPVPDLPGNNENRSPILERVFSITEVSKKLARAENTSPGPDRLTYYHWRSIPQGAKFLTSAFNTCIHFQKIPPTWIGCVRFNGTRAIFG